VPWPDLPVRVYQSLKILCCLNRAGGPLKARQIARLEVIAPAQAAKVLEHLAQAGFVHSRRGMKGGYWLALSTERIRVRDVLRSFGPRFPAREPRPNGVTKAMRKITEPARQAFEQLTIAAISRSTPKQPN
jgi:Rrf2 family protein